MITCTQPARIIVRACIHWMMLSHGILIVHLWLLKAAWCNTCLAPEFISNDGVSFTPNSVYVGRGDQAVVECEVEYTAQEEAPQSFLYINDCKMLGYNHPSWITRVKQTDVPCSYHDQDSRLCRMLTMYIGGTDEARGSRVYCCARIFGSRVCSRNSTITVVEDPQPTATHIRENCLPTKESGSETVSVGAISSPVVIPLRTPPSPPAVAVAHQTSHSQTVVGCSLTLLLANVIAMLIL